MSAVSLPSAINMIEKQGIASILVSNLQQNQISPSLRRTISADMSQRKWSSQNGMSKMERISSSEDVARASIEVNEHEELKQNMPTHDDLWSSTLLEKKDNNNETNNQTPPYVHPLLRKTVSNLSQKSLEICTESLGSETGSDGFSSCDEKEQKSEDCKVVEYNYNNNQKQMSQKKPFPPPLPSLHMQSHRNNGRLVVEAVSVPQQNYFQVDRQEGRLFLTLINDDPQSSNSPHNLDTKVADFHEVFDNFEEFGVNEEDEGEEKEVEMEIMIGQKPSGLPTSGIINSPNKSSVAWEIDSSILTQRCSWNNLKNYNNDMVALAKKVIMRGGDKVDYFVPLVCKENIRSLLMWQPHSIATS